MTSQENHLFNTDTPTLTNETNDEKKEKETQVNFPNNIEEEKEEETRISFPNDIEEEKEAIEPPNDEFADNSNVPKLSYWRIFLLNLWFGFNAWGGPVAQIALIKDTLVIKEKWITIPRFNRVFGVYQIVPGPEATELCMFFGCLSGGRFGGFLAGLGFVLPGFTLILLFSYIYVIVGLNNVYFNASFRALQPIVSAMVLRATHKIAEHALMSHTTHRFSYWLFAEAVTIGKWMTVSTFLDSIAIGNIIPSPLVMFSTFIGFQAGYLWGDHNVGYGLLGGLLIAIGMLFPCFWFTILGHNVLEQLVRNKFLAAFFDGISGTVVGIIAVTALSLLKSSIISNTGLANVSQQDLPILLAKNSSLAAVLYVLTLAALYGFKKPYLSLWLIIFGAIAGQFLFVN
ncbi:chromate transporter [Gigaspora rosea]|uniref:Chromate transporter n=1 Tax=Gigaspora rosea TaxID=44941 RepID=A0A397V5Q7_9GLOM|nr:chromate transporter [Gigaspora rosea]